MKRSLLATAFLVVLAITAITAASASAAVSILPLPTKTEAITSTSSAGLSLFGEGLFEIKSEKQTGTSTSTGETGQLGTFTDVFEGSKEKLGQTCTGLSDKTAGNVTVTGAFHISLVNSGGVKVPGVAFLINEVHLACGSVLIKVKGCVAGKIEGPFEKLVTSVVVSLAVTKGDNNIIKWVNDKTGVEENCELKAEINDKSPSLTSQATTLTLTGFKKGAAATTVLVMEK